MCTMDPAKLYASMIIVVNLWNHNVPLRNSRNSVVCYSNSVRGQGRKTKRESVDIVFCGPVENLNGGFQNRCAGSTQVITLPFYRTC